MKKYAKQDTEDIRREIQESLKDSQAWLSDVYDGAERDLRFRDGDQWPENYKKVRENKRPMMVKNTTKTIIQRIVNPFIKYPFGIKVNTNDPNLTKLIQDRVREIEHQSCASEAYEVAFDAAVTCGYGHFGVFTDYINDESLEQEPYIGLIRDPLSVWLDP